MSELIEQVLAAVISLALKVIGPDATQSIISTAQEQHAKELADAIAAARVAAGH